MEMVLWSWFQNVGLAERFKLRYWKIKIYLTNNLGVICNVYSNKFRGDM